MQKLSSKLGKIGVESEKGENFKGKVDENNCILMISVCVQ